LTQHREQSDKYLLLRIYGSYFEKANSARGFENVLADLGEHYYSVNKLPDSIIGKNPVMLESILSN